MASRDFEIHHLLTAYCKGIISDEFFLKQMEELCAGADAPRAERADGQGGAATAESQSARPRAVTGDAGLAAPGGIAMLAQRRAYDRAAEDLGNIVALEHVNVTFASQEKAAIF